MSPFAVARFSALVVLLLLCAFVPGARAGPVLDIWLERARAAEDDAPVAEHARSLPVPGIRIGWGEPQDGAWPAVVANEYTGRGGVRVQTGELAGHARLRVRLGATLRGDGTTRGLSFEGTDLSWGQGDARGFGEFYASVQRRHWGPGWSGSLILDGAAPAIPAVGWRRDAEQPSANRWFSWLGPWGADVFIARLSGHREPARPRLIGMRVRFEPIAGIDVGLARSIQWGGRGRDESWSSLRHALLGNDNVGYRGITRDNEPGNQLAGFDLRWRFAPASAASAYVQMVGEDEAGYFPSRNMLLAGVDTRVPVEHGSLRLFAEWSDTLAGRFTSNPRPGASYRHAVYLQGYTQDGVVLGHAAGADVGLASLGGIYREGAWGAVVVASFGRAEPTAQVLAPGRVAGFSASLRHARDQQGPQTGARWVWWRDTAQRRHALELWWQIPFE